MIMSSGSVVAAAAALTVKEFAALPFLPRAVTITTTTTTTTSTTNLSKYSVLSFFFGVEYPLINPTTTTTATTSLGEVEEDLTKSSDRVCIMRRGMCIPAMKGIWFGGGDEYDELCRERFTDLVRAAGTRSLGKPHDDKNDDWNTDIDGWTAQLILTDQLSRNIFRGQEEAFAYEDVSLEWARQLADQVLLQKEQKETVATMTENDGDEDGDGDGDGSNKVLLLPGEIYPPYVAFIITALMHSEEPDDHETCLSLLDYATKQEVDKQQEAHDSGSFSLQDWWKEQLAFELSHKRVIDQFGRYPHRNKLKGRESTREEIEWLADDQKVPMWAKSQG